MSAPAPGLLVAELFALVAIGAPTLIHDRLVGGFAVGAHAGRRYGRAVITIVSGGMIEIFSARFAGPAGSLSILGTTLLLAIVVTLSVSQQHAGATPPSARGARVLSVNTRGRMTPGQQFHTFVRAWGNLFRGMAFLMVALDLMLLGIVIPMLAAGGWSRPVGVAWLVAMVAAYIPVAHHKRSVGGTIQALRGECTEFRAKAEREATTRTVAQGRRARSTRSAGRQLVVYKVRAADVSIEVPRPIAIGIVPGDTYRWFVAANTRTVINIAPV